MGLPSRFRSTSGRRRGATPALTLLVVVAGLAATGTPLRGQAPLGTYQDACDGGDAGSCAVLGLAWEKGAGRRPDMALAAAYYQRACEGGIQVGCTNLGILYQDGRGVPRDLGRAWDLFRVACEQEEPLACDLQRGAERAADATYFKIGRITDAANGRPIDAAILSVSGLGVRATSDRFGRVQLGRLRPGRYAVSAERFGYEPLNGSIDVPGNAEFVMLMSRAAVDDPLARGRIAGRVSDQDANAGLSDVQITLSGTTTGTLSNSQGTFVLRDVEPGFVDVRFERIGYGTRTTSVIVQPGATVELEAAMSTRPIELNAVDVTVAGTSYERQGFEARARAGFGTHFTPADLERLRPQRMTDVLRNRVRGITTVTDFLGTHVVGRRSVGLAPDLTQAIRRVGPGADSASIAEYMSRGDYCELTVYLDGVAVQDLDIDSLDPETVEALEVYQGAGTPTQFLRNRCGAVLIWTRLGN